MAKPILKERVLFLIKTDGLKRGLVGDIIARLERAQLRLVGLKLVKVEEDIALKHYGQNDDWFEKIGQKIRTFYEKNGLDLEESLASLPNYELGKMVQKWNINYLLSGPVVAMVWEGFNAVAMIRKMVGTTYPQDSAPGTIRGDYSIDSPVLSNAAGRSVENLVHASGTVEEAAFEIDLWFKKDELMETVDA